MKRTVRLLLAALAALAVLAGLVHLVLVATHRSVPAATTVYGVTGPRVLATIAGAVALASLAVGGLALARPARRFAAAIAALLGGVIAAISGGLLLGAANGGPGSGNGVIGAAGAVVLGGFAVVVGAVAAARGAAHRRSVQR